MNLSHLIMAGIGTHLPFLLHLDTPHTVQGNFVGSYRIPDLLGNIRAIDETLITVFLDGTVQICTWRCRNYEIWNYKFENYTIYMFAILINS